MKIFIAIVALAFPAAPALAGNGGHMGGNSAVGIGVANSTANNAGNHQSIKDRLQAPGVGAVGLTSAGSCPIGSIGFGISGPGAGISFGTTRGDKDCRNAYLIMQAGFGRGVLKQYLVNNVPEIRDAVFPKGK